MKKILTLVLVITICSAIIRGRDVQFNGYAPGGAGQNIEVFSQPDPITWQQVLIDRIMKISVLA